jgi:hypothetical protein
MLVFIKKYYKWLGGILLTLVLGALGSPVWEFILKPLLTFTAKPLLYISTLGIMTYKNGIYVQIAQSFHEDISMRTYMLIVSALSGLILGYLLAVFSFDKNIGSDQRSPKLSMISKVFKNRLGRYLILLYAIFVVSFMTIDLAKENYINSAITYYYQSLKIVSPFISNSQEEELTSQFSSIKNKEDFVIVTNELKQLANKNKLMLPKSDFIF